MFKDIIIIKKTMLSLSALTIKMYYNMYSKQTLNMTKLINLRKMRVRILIY